MFSLVISRIFQIFDGNSKSAPLLGTICGSLTQMPAYKSSGNQILVVMRTDFLMEAKGFKAEYNRSCGARINVKKQDRISLDAPSVLLPPSQVNCSWILVSENLGRNIFSTKTIFGVKFE